MARFRVTGRYYAVRDGKAIALTAGTEVDLPVDEAAWISRDSPGTLAPVNPEPAPVEPVAVKPVADAADVTIPAAEAPVGAADAEPTGASAEPDAGDGVDEPTKTNRPNRMRRGGPNRGGESTPTVVDF